MFDKMLPVSITNHFLKCYLIGAMENPGKNDSGEGWRKYITPHLNSRGIYCFDPTKEETTKVGMSTNELLKKLSGWQASGNWDMFKSSMSKIWKGVTLLEEDPTTHEPIVKKIMGDVDYVEHSDFLIFFLHEGDKLGGSIAELTIAWYRGIPVYLVTEIPRKEINKSLLYFVLDSGHGKGNIFKNQTAVLKFIDNEYGTSGTIWKSKTDA